LRQESRRGHEPMRERYPSRPSGERSWQAADGEVSRTQLRECTAPEAKQITSVSNVDVETNNVIRQQDLHVAKKTRLVPIAVRRLRRLEEARRRSISRPARARRRLSIDATEHNTTATCMPSPLTGALLPSRCRPGHPTPQGSVHQTSLFNTLYLTSHRSALWAYPHHEQEATVKPFVHRPVAY